MVGIVYTHHGVNLLQVYSFCFLSKDEEARIKKEELDLKLAETAFDNFLQENDRLSMEAQKKYFYNLDQLRFLLIFE